MESLIHSKPNVNLRRINIVKWGSPVAGQYGIRELPTLWLYDGRKRVSTDMRDVFQRVSGL